MHEDPFDGRSGQPLSTIVNEGLGPQFMAAAEAKMDREVTEEVAQRASGSLGQIY
jgi:hypothetical protein